MRSYVGQVIGATEVDFVSQGTCVADDPPTTYYDEAYRCDGVGYASPMDEFLTCPN